MSDVDRNSQYGLTDDDLKRLGLVPNVKQYSLAYMLRRIKVHLEPDRAEAAFRPNEAMDDVIARVVALEASKKEDAGT